jgi:urease accessory protein
MEEGAWAERRCQIDVASGAFLCYRPLPVIPFAGSDFRGSTRIDLAETGAALAYSDIFCAGRINRGESFRFRRYQHLLEIRLGSRLLFRENTDFRPAEQNLTGVGLFEGYSHLLTMVLCGVKTNPDTIRSELNAAGMSVTAAVTTLDRNGGNFLVKALGCSAEELQWVCDYYSAGF